MESLIRMEPLSYLTSSSNNFSFLWHAGETMAWMDYETSLTIISTLMRALLSQQIVIQNTYF